MHLWANLKNFLYDTDDFMAYFNNKIYLFNFVNIISMSNKEIIIQFKTKKLIIKGTDLKPVKVLQKEILFTGTIGSVTIHE